MIYKENEIAVKSIKEGVIHGTGVRFGSPETKDYDGEWFSDQSDVGLVNGTSRPFLIEHGWNQTFGKSRVADAVYEKMGTGWEYEATFLSNEIGNKAYNQVIGQPYRSSAGAAAHTRSATLIKNTFHLDTWFIAEQSVTLTPADSENPRIVRVKSDPIAFMLEETQRLNQAFIVELLEGLAKGNSEARDRLATVLTDMKDSFKNQQIVAPAITSEFLEELEQVVQPVSLLSFK